MGEVRPVPSRGFWRIVAGLSLWSFVKSLVRLVGRLLGHRRPASLHLEPQGLVLRQRRLLVGHTIGTSQTIFPIRELSEVTLLTNPPARGVTAGLVALSLGTYFGAGLFIEGLRAPGSAPSLLGLGLLFVAGGALLDYSLDSGWLFSHRPGHSTLILRSSSGARMAIFLLDAPAAQSLIQRIQGALSEASSEPGPAAGSSERVSGSSASGGSASGLASSGTGGAESGEPGASSAASAGERTRSG